MSDSAGSENGCRRKDHSELVLVKSRHVVDVGIIGDMVPTVGLLDHGQAADRSRRIFPSEGKIDFAVVAQGAHFNSRRSGAPEVDALLRLDENRASRSP